LLVLGTKAQQNFRRKVAKVRPKGGKLAAKVFTARSKFFFSICTAKIAIIHTFSGLCTLSKLLAHFLGGMLLS